MDKKPFRSLCEKWMPGASDAELDAAADNFAGFITALRDISRAQIERDRKQAEAEGREYVYVSWGDRPCPDCGRPNKEHE